MERRIFVAILLAVSGDVRLAGGVPAAGSAGARRDATDTVRHAARRDRRRAGRAGAPAVPPPSAAPSAPAPDAIITEPTEREIVVETATVQAVLTNRGGRILHWRLKDYRDGAGNPVDLVPSNVPAEQPRPFSLAGGGSAADAAAERLRSIASRATPTGASRPRRRPARSASSSRMRRVCTRGRSSASTRATSLSCFQRR